MGFLRLLLYYFGEKTDKKTLKTAAEYLTPEINIGYPISNDDDDDDDDD